MRLDIEGKHMTLAPHLMGWIAERLEDLNTPDDDICEAGFDHGAGHPLLFMDDAKAPNCRKNNEFKDLGNYSEWPKVAGAVIKAVRRVSSLCNKDGVTPYALSFCSPSRAST